MTLKNLLRIGKLKAHATGKVEIDRLLASLTLLFLADFNGTVHRDVKLIVLHDKVTQLQPAHGDCVGGCPSRGRQGPNRFEDVDVQP